MKGGSTGKKSFATEQIINKLEEVAILLSKRNI
jgi:hypothetical protein